MVRAGLLSPASRIVKAQAAPAHSKADSLVSLGLGTPRAAHDTDKRIRRHRDGRMLRDGIGLTTGLGWSDSEDEDAPSPLRHRLSSILLSRMPTSSRHSLMTSRSGPLSRSTSSSTLSSGSATPYSPPMALAALGIGAAGIGLGIGIGGPPVKAVASNGSQVKLPRAHRPSLPLPVSTSAKVSQVRKAASHALLPTERPSFSSSVSAPPPPTLMNPKSKVVEDTSRSETPRARVPSGDSIRSPTLSASPLPTMRTRTTSNTSNASSAYSSHSLNADSSGLTSSDTSDASHNAPSIVHFSKTTPSSRSKLSSKNYNVPAPIVPPMTAMSLTFPAPPPLTPGARAAAAAKGKYIQRISPSRMPSSGISVGAN